MEEFSVDDLKKVIKMFNEEPVSTKFICDGCGDKYNQEDMIDVNTQNLAGIVMCKNCINKE